MRNESVYCKVCGKKLAWWDVYSNIQYEDEYECQGKFRRLTHGKVWRSKCSKNILHSNRRDAKGKKEYPIEVKSETLKCALYYHTKYCRSCVRKIKYKCVRPRCRGKIVLVRRQDSKSTKYEHGGY